METFLSRCPKEFYWFWVFCVFWTSAVLKYDRIKLTCFLLVGLSFFNHSGITCTYFQSHSLSIVNFFDLFFECLWFFFVLIFHESQMFCFVFLCFFLVQSSVLFLLLKVSLPSGKMFLSIHDPLYPPFPLPLGIWSTDLPIVRLPVVSLFLFLHFCPVADSSFSLVLTNKDLAKCGKSLEASSRFGALFRTEHSSELSIYAA